MFGNARIIRFAALSLALLTVAASAETFTVDLDLSGYPNIQFDIGRRFLSIQSVTFTCNGTMLAGLDYRGQPFSGQVVLWLRANPGYKIAEGPLAGQSTYPAAEPFTGQSSFRSVANATWGFLLDGTGDGWFDIEPSLFVPEQQPLQLPSAAIGSAALIIEATPAPTPIIYVDDDAPTPGDGQSWQTAYKYLQDALMMAAPPAEIRVAQGAYKPDLFALSDRPNLGRYETFHLINGVALRGGYAGPGEPDPNARDIRLYESILSADLAGNDEGPSDADWEKAVFTPMYHWQILDDLIRRGTRGDNAYTVVTAEGVDPTAVLDGFTITAGHADGTDGPWDGPQANGAGIYNRNADPTILNCTFLRNTTCGYDIPTHGAGMFNSGSRPLLRHCAFLQNVTWGANGLARGGAVFDINSAPTFTDCILHGNVADGYDSDYYGGAVYDRDSNSTFTRCLLLRNCSEAAAVVINDSRPAFFNCTFAGNPVAISCEWWFWPQAGPSSLQAINCIFADGAISNDGGCWDGIQVAYSDVAGAWPGVGNIDADPCFVKPGYWYDNETPEWPNDDFWVEGGDYHLKSQAGRWDAAAQSWVIDDVTSPCIDAGDPLSPVGHEPFPNGGCINMGAYGGTPEASKSYFGGPSCETIVAGDINGDCKVDLSDFALLSLHWLDTSQ